MNAFFFLAPKKTTRKKYLKKRKMSQNSEILTTKAKNTRFGDYIY